MARCAIPLLVLACLVTIAGAQGAVFGIGVTFARVGPELRVDSVVPDSPAARAGLKVGDRILTINDASTVTMTEGDASARLAGAQGSTVRLTFSPFDNSLHQIEVPRSLPTAGGTPIPATPPPAQGGTPPPARNAAPPPPAPRTPSLQGATPMPQPPAAANPVQAAAAAQPAGLNFVTWIEPKEHSFSLDVPQGWNITGGLYWVGPMTPAVMVRAQSPDGKLQIFVGDSELMPRQVPTPIAVAANRTGEGGIFKTPAGDPILMQRYLTGVQFAKFLVTSRHCPNARWLSESERPDMARGLAAALQPQVARLNMTMSATAGDAGFACDTREGYVTAATMLVTGNGGAQQAWMIQGLGGFLSADPMRSMQARYILERMMATQKDDPQWMSAYEQRVIRVTGSILSMQNAAFQVQQSAYRSASSTLSMLNHPNQGVNSPAQRASSSTNTTLGTRDMCDAIGRCKTVTIGSGSVFIDHSGKVVSGPASGGPPDNTGVWSPMYER